MASLATHLSASLFLIPIGVRRFLCSSSLYLTNPSLFRSKTWYLSEPRWKNLDLYALILILPISSFCEIFLFLSLSGHPSYRFTFFQQSAADFLFWVLILLIIFREIVNPLLVSESFLFVFAGIAFLVEYSVIGNGISGFGSSVYQLLGGLTLICAASCFYLSFKPSSFFADFFLSSALVFKGTWLLQAGLSLFTDTFSVKGCGKMSVLPAQATASVQCDLDEDTLRGVSLMNLLFTIHGVGVLAVSLVMFGLSSYHRKLSSGEGSGPLLDSETMLMMRSSPEIEIE